MSRCLFFTLVGKNWLRLSITYLLDALVGAVDDGYEEVGDTKDEQDDERVEVTYTKRVDHWVIPADSMDCGEDLVSIDQAKEAGSSCGQGRKLYWKYQTQIHPGWNLAESNL